MLDRTVSGFLTDSPDRLLDQLAGQAMRSFRTNESQQLRAWDATIRALRTALMGWDAAMSWRIVLEFSMRRLGRRVDAILVTPRAVLVLEFKVGQSAVLAGDLRQVEDYALDLHDFHAGSRGHVILPILVATAAPDLRPTTWPLLLNAVAPVLSTGEAGLSRLLRDVWGQLPEPSRPLDLAGWTRAAYRPVPGIVDAARNLYAQHGVEDIADTRADAKNLAVTTSAIRAAIDDARRERRHIIVFVTGIPGAGKTLCGLNVVFGAEREQGAIFLTGNPTLVHVLREALARDAACGDRNRLRAARQRTKTSIQALPAFRDHHVRSAEIPAERVVVIDEAQRAWSRAHAVRKSAIVTCG